MQWMGTVLLEFEGSANQSFMFCSQTRRRCGPKEKQEGVGQKIQKTVEEKTWRWVMMKDDKRWTRLWMHNGYWTNVSWVIVKLLYRMYICLSPWWLRWRKEITQKLLHTEDFTHRRVYTEELLHTDAFTHTRRKFYTEKSLHRGTFTRRNLYTEEFFHTDAFTQHLLRTEIFTHKFFYPQKLFIRIRFLTEKYFTQRNFHTQKFYTMKLLHKGTVAHRNVCTQKLLHTEVFT